MTTLNLQVSDSTDDCTRRLTSSYFTLTLGVGFCGDYDSGNYDWSTGMRWTGAVMSPEDPILSATMQFYALTPDGGIPTTYLKGEDVDDALTFSTSGDYDGRARTSSITWTPGAWANNTWYTTPEVKTLLQTIVDRVGYAGDGVAFFWSDASGWGGSQKRLSARSRNYSSALAPKLDIDYTPSVAPWAGYSQAIIII